MMKRIQNSIFNKDEFIETLKSAISKFFNEKQDNIENSLRAHFDALKDNLWFYLEYPYVDKVYRNSYYSYFSSKHKEYNRDCIRISIFNSKIDHKQFRNEKYFTKLISSFLGYIVLRPTINCLVGRSMISPKAMKNDEILCCLVNESSLINGVICIVSAFPHSSQDQETITCAETTIWSLLEYFGNKYSFYSPVLPSEILNVSDSLLTERVIPSSGLKASEISYALKEFGFSPKTYTEDVYGEKELRRILSYYVESGIPLIVAIENEKIGGHAIIYCGHENFNHTKIDNCSEYSSIPLMPDGNLHVYDTADIEKKYVVVDDNYPPYQISSFDNPTEYYDDPDFKGCKITCLIVPLYPKIYLEAYKARKLVDFIISSSIIGIGSYPESILIRFFLTSSRSYKKCVILNNSFDDEYRELIIETAMPKFIWIAELSTKDLYKQNKAFGFIIIDATGSDTTESIILIAYSDRFIFFEDNKIKVLEKDNNYYNIYINNLKGRWNQWQE